MNCNAPIDTTEPPLLFFLPGIGEGEAKNWEPFGDVVRLAPLSYLDWPELVKPKTTMATLIRHLTSQIQTRQPNGPLHLVGYSIGGPLAYGCILALRSEGRIADSLSIIDGRTYGPPPTKFRERWEHLTTFRLRAGLASVIAKVLTRKRALPLLRRLSPFRNVTLPFGFGDFLHSKLRIRLTQGMFQPWWSNAAQPKSDFPTPAFLFRSDEQHPWESEDFGWSNYCRILTVTHVAGTHASILAPESLGPLCAELIRMVRVASTGSVFATGWSTKMRS